MPVDPTGPISLAIDTLRKMVAKSATFQGWTGNAGDEAEAAKSVYYVGSLIYTPGVAYTKDNIQDARPFVIINLEPREGFELVECADGTYIDRGALTLHFEDNLPDNLQASGYQDEVITFTNNVGGTLSDVTAQHGGGALVIPRIRSDIPVTRSLPKLKKSMGDFHFMRFAVTYGLQLEK